MQPCCKHMFLRPVNIDLLSHPMAIQQHEISLQIESRVLEHLYGGAPADHVVQQLQAAREDTLAANTALQVLVYL